MSGASRSVWAGLGIATLSGAAGLMHQTIWVRRMVDLLGADGATFSRIVAAFFLGLAAGAWLSTRVAPRRPWRAAAAAELAIALLSVLPLVLGVLDPSTLTGPRVAHALSAAWPLLLVTPPALAMGMVLPWIIRAVGAPQALPLYALNTLGGLFGLLLVMVWSLPALGLTGAGLVAVACNLAASAFAFWMERTPEKESVPAPSKSPAPSRQALWLAFASGFLVLASEVLFQHQLAQLLISSHFSSALVLAVVIVSLALAAALVGWPARLGDSAISLALAAGAVAFAMQPLLLVLQRGGLHYLPFDRPFLSYLGSAMKLTLLGCGLPMLAAGLLFPILLRTTSAEQRDVGLLFAVNGVGGWLGAEAAERVLGPVCGLWWSISVLAGGYVLCFAAFAPRWRLAGSLGLAAVAIWSWQIDARLPFAGLVPGDHLAKVSMGREGVVALVHGEGDDWRLLLNNSYTLGGTRAQANQERQTLLPLLLHGRAQKVCTLGVATGSTLAGALLDPAVTEVEGIELSPLVIQFARADFAPWNRHMATDPRVRLTLGDARRVIGERPGAFDVIEGDLFLPWQTGESRLFTREHFTAVKRALRPDGLFCQWLPLYQLTERQFNAIARTFQEVFPEAWLVRGDFYTSMPIVALIGGRSPASVDWAKTDAACARLRAFDACRDPLVRHVEGVAMCVLGPLHAPEPGPIITLGNCWLEWDAARNVIGQREPWFIGVPNGLYLRALHAQGNPILPPSLQPAHAAGLYLHTLEIAAASSAPKLAALQAELPQRLPHSMQSDPVCDWSHFPMRHRLRLP